MQLSGWGRFPRHEVRLSAPREMSEIPALLAQGPLIARGMGRAYGDSAISRHTLSTRHLNRMIDFDAETGVLVAESGVTLAGIIDAFLPRGWFPMVTPGTRFVSLGGAIAADVHGKNHHGEGSFGTCLDWIDLMGADGIVQRCSRTENPEMFHWTLGGMGLTGVILRARIRLRRVESGWIRQTIIPARSLTEAIEAFDQTASATYSVAWIDGVARGEAMGRSLVMTSEHAARAELPSSRRAAPFAIAHKRARRVPFTLPGFVLNPLTVRLFNTLYFNNGLRQPTTGLVDWASYFYPLDAVADWNRIYGPKGFLQFQVVLPMESHAEGLRRVLEAVSRSGTASFLAVLKRFGAQDSRLSFPMEGFTLALDFPINSRSLALMSLLDRITVDHGGRFYLAKDSRITADTLRRTDPRWADFARMRRESGLNRHFLSAQSERLDL